jgi:predicted enzyme related to lactoylglutathione lyase
MAIDLSAGSPVDDYAAALAWYERLLGSPPTFFPHDTEAVWELAEHRSVFIVQRPEHAGHAMHTIIVDDFDALVAQIADRGLEPTKRETYSNGVRKATYCDPDGNEIGFGGVPSGRT